MNKFLMLMILVSGCRTVVSSSKKYSKLDGKCEVTKISWDNSPDNCYCKIVGESEDGKGVYIFVPINDKYCKEG